MEILEFHEFANIYPMIVGDEYKYLEDSIRGGYQKEYPIYLYEGKILDGRNRYVVCLKLEIEPRFAEYTGNDPVGFVIISNGPRRMLNATQKALVANRLANMPVGGDIYYHRSPRGETGLTNQEQAAERIGASVTTMARCKEIEKYAPDLLPKMESGEINARKAERIMKDRKRKNERDALAKIAELLSIDERYDLFTGDMRTIELPDQYDFIITDPPYPKEYLPLYGDLARRAGEWLKPQGLLIAMCGQSYLDEIYALMSQYLQYYWTACYLTPGQPKPLRQRQVNASWKPLLIYGSSDYKGKIFGDVFTSEKPDKEHHEWGQSESGMLDIIKQICLPGQSILDPFCGAGTTGVAALKHGCVFTGIDLEQENIKLTKGRLSQV